MRIFFPSLLKFLLIENSLDSHTYIYHIYLHIYIYIQVNLFVDDKTDILNSMNNFIEMRIIG